MALIFVIEKKKREKEIKGKNRSKRKTIIEGGTKIIRVKFFGKYTKSFKMIKWLTPGFESSWGCCHR